MANEIHYSDGIIGKSKPDEEYDLSAPARVVVPSDAPILYALPVEPIDATTAATTCVISQWKPLSEMQETAGDAKARCFAELIYALKITEEAWIQRTLGTHGEHETSPDVLANRYILGEAQGYKGMTSKYGSDVNIYVTHDVCLMTRDHEILSLPAN